MNPSAGATRILRWISVVAAICYYLQVFSLIYPANAQSTNVASKKVYAEGYCSMYGICGQRSDGKALNCPKNIPSIKPDKLLSSKIQSLCPTISGNVCCTADQFDILRGQVQQAVPLLVGCPACLRNFLNLFCMLSCSPDQSLFINVTSIMKVNNSLTVDGIDFYVTSAYGEELYNSCENVKFGTTNTRAMDFVGGGAQTYQDWLSFFGKQSAPNEPGSPFAIQYRSNIPYSLGMKPMNVTVHSCGDPLLGCSCGDCPSACTGSLPPAPHQKVSCRIRIGSLKVKCLEFSLAVLYIVLVAAFLVRSLQLRREGDGFLSRAQLPLNDKHDNDLHSEKKTSEEGRPVVKALQPSVVQGFISNFFRKYGAFVSRNPILVLCLSLSVPLLLCIGLIHFKVETRPEKLWVGSGSKSAEEKQYFDNHLAPFYRIEQFVLATLPVSKNGKPPSIVTDKNINLLFEIQKKIDGLRGNYSGSAVSLSDICLKPLGKDCATQSVLQYFKMDPENYVGYGGVEHAGYCFQHYTSAETCLSAFQAPLDPSTALGGFSGSNYSEASAFVVTYPVNNKVDKTGEENGKAVAWERAFIRLLKEEIVPMVQSQNLTVSFSSESSIQEELKRESTGDVITITVSYLVMFAYISFTLGDTSLSSVFVSSKVLLGLSGVVVVMLSVLGSIGFYSAIGVKSTLIIIEVIPFLVLAVAVIAPNIPAMYELHFAIPMTGAVLCTLNTRHDSSMVSLLLSHSNAKVIFADHQFLGICQGALKLLSHSKPKLPLVIPISDSATSSDLEYEALLKTSNPAFEINWPLDECDPISLNYTSGTTSRPKGVIYSHRGAYLNALAAVLLNDITTMPVYLWTVPMFHCNGWCLAWGLAAQGGINVCLRNVIPRDIFDSISRRKVTHMGGAPTVLNMIVNSPVTDRKQLPGKVIVMTGAAPPPPKVLFEMEELGFHVIHSYGLTETYGPGTVCTWKPEWDGLPLEQRSRLKARQGLHHVGMEEVDVKDPETMKSVPFDGKTMGEVMFRGNTVMNGYLNDRKATEDAFRGGWFRSGDLGVRQDDGYIQLKDRSKDIIISGGENISTIEVESVLFSHPMVLEAAVVGRPDDNWGETPCAFVKLKDGPRVSEEEIISFCRSRLPHYMAPKTVVFEELPKTSTGKTQKYVLRERAKGMGSLSGKGGSKL